MRSLIILALFSASICAAHAGDRVPAFLVGDWSSEGFTLQVRANGMGEAWMGTADAMGIFLYDGHYVPSKRVLYFHAGTISVPFKYDPKTKTLRGDQSVFINATYKCTQPLIKNASGPLLPIVPPVPPAR